MRLRTLLGVGAILLAGSMSAQAQQAKQLSIATEVTGGSIDNMKLVAAGNADVAFTQVDTAVDAINGNDKFPKKLPIKALVVMYVNLMQVVTVEGNGITKFEDLKGKRV